jgi:glycosyltransferase involved in cell wall biosynthesis
MAGSNDIMQHWNAAATSNSPAPDEARDVNNETSPKLSVAIKTYNHAPYVGKCIESVLSQPFGNFEIIVTDDASTDGTPDVVRSFADPRIKLEVLPQNLGISGSMNQTVARAKGEYIAILNSDDYALPGRFMKQVEYLDSHPDVDAVFGQPLLISENGEPSNAKWEFPLPADSSRAGWLRHFFFHCNFICAPTAMIRRKAYEAVGQYDRRLTQLQDFDMWIRFLMHDRKMVLLPEQFTAFRVRNHQQNASAGTLENGTRAHFEYAMILARFRNLDVELLRNIFSRELSTGHLTAGEKDIGMWLSEIALSTGSPSHNLFGLLTLFESAKTHEDFLRLKDAAGRVDLFGRAYTSYLEKRIADIRENTVRGRMRKFVSRFVR